MIVRRALFSASSKRGLVAFAQALSELGIELVASSGTADALRKAKLNVQQVSQLTGFPEVLDGRVKTLHPTIHAGLLVQKDQPQQLRQLKRHGIPPIDLIAVNLYPFAQKVNAKTELETALSLIDIGGEAMIRAAAKNFRHVVVLVDPRDYDPILKQLTAAGDVDADTRRMLARKAFVHVTRYNAAISRYFDPASLPLDLCLAEPVTHDLRYGENPSQSAALYGGRVNQLQGKAVSYTNVLDLECAWHTVERQKPPAAAIVKHATPCGAGLGKTQNLAFEQALKGDSQSAFGGVIGLNRSVGPSLAKRIVSRFFEAVVAPSYAKTALQILASKPNLRLVIAPENSACLDVRSTAFGWLAQTKNPPPNIKFAVATHKTPTDKQKQDLRFGWSVVEHVKSNAIVLVKNRATVGIGTGQMSRVDAVKIAIEKAGKRTRGAVLASDGFFPFPDAIELAVAAGIKAIVQPGGSVKDKAVIDAANRHNIAMVMTGARVFRH